METNTQQFIKQAREKGIPDKEIYNYLQSKGQVGTKTSTPQEQPKERESSGGILGYVAPYLATLPQAIGLAVGARGISKINESDLKVQNAQADLATSVSNKLKTETDPIKKAQLKKQLADISKNMQERGARMSELASGKGLSEATKIDIPLLAKIPGLKTDPGQATQQIAGRSVKGAAVAAGSALGMAGSGALYGAGNALEKGKSPVGIATESATTALLFKGTGFVLGKLAETGIGQKLLTAPPVASTLKFAEKVYSPFVGKLSAPGTFGAEVESKIQDFGKAVDKIYSPSTYTKPLQKGAVSLIEKTGLRGTPEERLSDAEAKVTKYWTNAKNRYQSAIKYDEKSPEILGREGIIPRQIGNRMDTSAEAEIVRQKGYAEHSLLNKILQGSQEYATIGQVKQEAINSITQNMKGVERYTALNAFNKQFDTLVSQNKNQIVNGDRIPVKLLNDFKSYLWSQGYANKLAPKSDQINAVAMRLGGNALKTHINTIFQESDPAMANAIIKLNEHSGELFQASKFLESMNGKPLPGGGFMGRYFLRVAGAVVGSSAGPLGGVAGTLSADKLVVILQNPEFSVGKSAALIAQLRKTNPKVVEDALRILGNLESQKAQVLQLSSKAGQSSAIELPDVGVLKGQATIKDKGL